MNTEVDTRPPRQTNEPRVAAGFAGWLDLFRWLAAGSVLVSHLAIRMLMPYDRLPTSAHTLPMRGYVFLAGFDHYAVMVFFVLSGFLVGTPVWRAIAGTGTYDRARLTDYILKRVTRLGTVLWPALCLSGMAAAAARHIAPDEPSVWGPGLDHALGTGTFACNAVFLQTAACVQYAQNGALWSLYNEFWYYSTWPLLAVALLGRAVVLPWRVLCGITFAVAFALLTHFQFTGSAWGPYMAIWLMGVVAGARGRPIVRRAGTAAWLFGLVLLAVRLGVRRQFAANPMIAYGLDVLVAGLFANLLLTLRHTPALPAPWGERLHARLAGFSFSLYVIHVPALVLYIAVLLRLTHTGWRMAYSGGVVWIEVAGGLLAGIGAGFALWLLAERHTPVLRRMIAGWLSRTFAASTI